MGSKEQNAEGVSTLVGGEGTSEKGTHGLSRSDAQLDSIEGIRLGLADHIGTLRFLNSSLMVCVQALQRQDAEMDSDIALILQRSVSDKFDETIDRIESIALGLEHDGT